MAERKATASIGFEKQIWDAACVLRGNLDASEYKSVVLGLIFLKYISDSFEEKYRALVEEGDGFEEDIDEYTAEGIFFVPPKARWSEIAAKAHTPEIGTVIDDAMRSIEKENKRLKDILPKNFARPELDKRRLGDVVDLFTNIQMIEHGSEKDILGRTYEYCLARFAEQEGKLAGEFYAPSCVVRTLVEVLQPYHGRVYEIIMLIWSQGIRSALEREELITGCDCVGAFLQACYEQYLESAKTFALLFDALAADASGNPDDFQKEAADAFRGFADEMYDVYVKKCSVRQKNGGVSVETHEITNLLQLLTFEFCRLKKEGKAIKICANCERYFIPPHRIDSKYCPMPAPQDPSKACNEIGSQVLRTEKRKTDPREREHHNTRSKLHMAAKRARDNGEDELIPWYKAQLKKEMEQYTNDHE